MVQATAEQLVKDARVQALRGGEHEDAVILGPSAKKEGQWKLKFASDGKVLAKPLDAIKVSDGEDEGAWGLGESDDEGSDGDMEFEEVV
jgi:hypothetical protein